MKKSTLIYFDVANLAPVGGPSGYLYSLKTGLEEINATGVDFLNNQSQIKGSIKRLKSKYVKAFGKGVIYQRAFSHTTHFARTDLSNYDNVHFHVVKDIFEARDELQDYAGHVLLTPHSPCLPSEEIVEQLSSWEKRLFPAYSKLEEIDRYAFERADILVFPCPEAEEPYFKASWYKSIRKKKKVAYCLTGTIQSTPKAKPGSFRKIYSIPDDAFVICYIGRHNSIKGYDRLKRIASEILRHFDNVWFLIAGKEEPMYRLEHDRWIEVGWCNDTAGLINDSDIFILPNRDTYFDLVLLECLSIGIPVLASKTGGNRFFQRINSPGIKLFDSFQQCVDQIGNYIECHNSNQLDQIRDSNRMLYNRIFNEKRFAKRYQRLIESL